MIVIKPNPQGYRPGEQVACNEKGQPVACFFQVAEYSDAFAMVTVGGNTEEICEAIDKAEATFKVPVKPWHDPNERRRCQLKRP